MCTYVPVHMCVGACGPQKRASNPLVLAFQESMSQCGWLEQNLSPLEVKHSWVHYNWVVTCICVLCY